MHLYTQFDVMGHKYALPSLCMPNNRSFCRPRVSLQDTAPQINAIAASHAGSQSEVLLTHTF
jgi:hypothetical protein